MVRNLLPALSLAYLLLAACGPGEAGGPATEDDRQLTDSLELLRTRYDSLLLWESLATARRTRSWMEARGDRTAPRLRAQVYQYLAQLHFHHVLHDDSIRYFTAAAEEILPEPADAELTARQLLCRTYAFYTDWSWLDMDMTAELGLQSLAAAGRESSPLFAELLLIQGYARKKYGDNANLSPAVRETARTASEQRYRRAAAICRELGSPCYYKALERLTDYRSRFPDREAEVRATIAELARSERARRLLPGLPDRLAMYWHTLRDQPDSVAYYAERVLRADRPFEQLYRQEANFGIVNFATGRGDYQRALDTFYADARATGCYGAPPGSVSPFVQQYDCGYYRMHEADIYLKRYRAHGQAADLQTAFALTRDACSRYTESFATFRDAGALSKMYELGASLLDISLEVAFAAQEARPDAAHLEALFETMELGKSLLLVRDLRDADWDAQEDRLRRIRAELALLTQAYTHRFTLGREELERFQQLHLDYARSVAAIEPRQRPDQRPEDAPEAVPELRTVRRELAPNEALVELADTRSATFALYVDADTVIVYRVESGTDTAAAELAKALAAHALGSPADFDLRAHRVYRGLFGPVASRLEGKSSLLFAPSPAFQPLPIGLLTVRPVPAAATFRDLAYLLDGPAVRYLPSWRVEREHRDRREALTAGGYAAGVWTNPQLTAYLGGLGDEVLGLSDAGGRHFAGPDCTSESLLASGGTYDLLHLSVHARGNPGRFEENYLYLSATDSLNAVALLASPLRARLVVLAACSTDRGYTQRGEGTFSLRRSFRLAGVPDVICSQFEIPADATGVVLGRFYQYLRAEGDAAAALARAQRDCRSGAVGKRYADPYYWGGLILG